MATKADVESVKVEVQSVRVEIESVRVEVESVKVEVERLRSEIKESKISTILWVTGIMLALQGSTIAILRAWPA